MPNEAAQSTSKPPFGFQQPQTESPRSLKPPSKYIITPVQSLNFCVSVFFSVPLLRRLEVVHDDGALLRLLTPVLDNDARAVDNLAGVTLAVEDAWEETLVRTEGRESNGGE